MAFTLEHVHEIRKGRPQQVGVLPDDVWRKLSWRCPWVYLGQSGLKHIAAEHPDITDFDLLRIPMAIASGTIIQLLKSPRKILVTYKMDRSLDADNAEPKKWYLCALKEAQNGTEIWVDSFYRIKPNRLTSLARGGTVLRSQR